MRKATITVSILLLLPLVAFAVLAFPHFELRRFTELPSINPLLTDHVLAVIDSNNHFEDGKYIVDVSQEVCGWDAREELLELATQPGWQLTSGRQADIWFKKTTFWPWDRDGLVVTYGPDRLCSAAVHRSDTV